MSAVPATSPRQGDRAYVVGLVPARQRLAAAKRLVAASAGDTAAARRMLEVAASHGIDLSHFWGSFPPSGGLPRQVVLAVPGSGSTATLFTSAPESAAEEAELARVIDQACQSLGDVALAQVLLEPHERAARTSFSLAGFRWVGGLAYMRRDIPTMGEFASDARPTWPAGIDVRHPRPGEDQALIRAMDASYEQTLDCPELCGLRHTADVLRSHRATGVFEPALWWLVERESQPQGLMLLNPCPDQGSVELVYLGLGPVLRGLGLGRSLLRMGLSRLAGRAERSVTLAVDERNDPARRLYASLGFGDVAHRSALVRPAGGTPVEKPRTQP